MPDMTKIKKAFTLTLEDLRQIAENFRRSMVSGLTGDASSLKMLPSFLAKPQGDERGTYLALDFGGTNVRVLLIELLGDGRWDVRQKITAPLKDPQGKYDYTSSSSDARELFGFIADLVIAVGGKDQNYRLGHTFSFPCRQQSVNQAVLLSWTKEIKTAGVEGREISELLTAALELRGGGKITPAAIINDTVGTLLAAAYTCQTADLGSICGTGHNTCYFDYDRKMIINMESGNFDKLPYSIYDELLDKNSEKPGAQRLEKMASGKYLGNLVGLAANDLLATAFGSGALSAEDISYIAGGEPAPAVVAHLSKDQLNDLRQITQLVINRSAGLVAATFVGVINCIDPDLKKPHIVAIDGSLYEKMPGYSGHLQNTIKQLLGDKAHMITIKLSKDGSGIGAAIAASLSGPEN